MELFVDSSDGRALTTQLYDQLRHAMLDGQLSAGDRLVPSRSRAAAGSERGLSRTRSAA